MASPTKPLNDITLCCACFVTDTYFVSCLVRLPMFGPCLVLMTNHFLVMISHLFVHTNNWRLVYRTSQNEGKSSLCLSNHLTCTLSNITNSTCNISYNNTPKTQTSPFWWLPLWSPPMLPSVPSEIASHGHRPLYIAPLLPPFTLSHLPPVTPLPLLYDTAFQNIT